MNRRTFISSVGFPAIVKAQSGSAAARPNIFWIIGDDEGIELSCYGDRVAKTPNIDRLANEGTRFTQFHTTAPVCSASRSGFNVGLYQIATGTHNHRSHRKDGYKLPSNATPITDRFRAAGYFTCNVLDVAPGVRGTGKTDFNFAYDGKPFDGTHWNQRKPGQPFFAQINFQAPHKGPAFVAARKQKNLVDPKSVELPPFYPDHPVVRDEVANYYDAIHLLDYQIGVLREQLEKDNLLENTVLMHFGDNGRCLLRGKQWLYDHGTRVPLIVRWPGAAKPGAVRDEPCTALDMNASSLAAAGIPIPDVYHGRPLFGSQAKPNDVIFTARDRCDMTIDRIRAVRDKRYKYIRNYMPERPYTQFNEYIKNSYPTLGVLKELRAAGKLNATQELFMAARKPEVEFYDTAKDPFEIHNLAADPSEKKRVAQFGKRLDDWVAAMHDKGAALEPLSVLEKEESRLNVKE